ncbi:MAG TPA: aminotransferase class V-fold PLP-dependent enzyme [Caldilineaceae bacterium]|nr:aminotransferase class V-fold PLP-dependent enzyme [Caldilineaceae bacterium]
MIRNQMQTLPAALPLPHLADQFLLRKDIAFLNHGSFGACPRPVFETYQRWQHELELNPVIFMGRLRELLAEARARLARYVGTVADNLVFVPNATHGLNIVTRSLKLKPGDEVLSTDHEYGAIDRSWRFNCERQGAYLINRPIPTPIHNPEEVVEHLWAGVTERTKVIALSHITSPTALILPVEAICRRARAAGIITVIDGAHAPGQVDLNLEQLGADFYSGNAHKWLSSPKGAAFLYARSERQGLLEPLVVSHGWQSRNPGPSQFLDYFSWVGTDDPAAYLSVPAAIEFQEQHDWPAVRQACHALALEAQRRILALSGLPALSPDSMWMQMVSVPLPGQAADYQNLWDEYQIVVPIFEWNGHTLVRISVQAYNTPQDIDRLVHALATRARRAGLSRGAESRPSGAANG